MKAEAYYSEHRKGQGVAESALEQAVVLLEIFGEIISQSSQEEGGFVFFLLLYLNEIK